jgi:hypothetical protein
MILSSDQDSYDVDTPVAIIEANAADRRRRAVSMPRGRWFALDDQARKVWDQLSDYHKSIILGLSDSGRPSTSRLPPPDLRHVNFHGLLPPDETKEHFEDVQPPDDHVEHKEVNQAARSSPTKTLPPHDIRRVLHEPKKAPDKRQVNTHRVHYRVAINHRTPVKRSLVDRGANGGCLGEDAIRLATHLPKREAVVEGVGKHQTPVVEIVSGAGYIITNKGPVILIMHQMADIGNGPTKFVINLSMLEVSNVS